MANPAELVRIRAAIAFERFEEAYECGAQSVAAIFADEVMFLHALMTDLVDEAEHRASVQLERGWQALEQKLFDR